jgi:hypothetical protein
VKKFLTPLLLVATLAMGGAVLLHSAPKAFASGCTGSYSTVYNISGPTTYTDNTEHVRVQVALDGNYDENTGALCQVRADGIVTNLNSVIYNNWSETMVCLAAAASSCSPTGTNILASSGYLDNLAIPVGSNHGWVGPWVTGTAGMCTAGKTFRGVIEVGIKDHVLDWYTSPGTC